MKKKSPKDLLNQAIEEAGGAAKVADHFGFAYPSAVYNWSSKTTKKEFGIPLARAVKLCKMAGVTVTPEQLRPDIY